MAQGWARRETLIRYVKFLTLGFLVCQLINSSKTIVYPPCTCGGVMELTEPVRIWVRGRVSPTAGLWACSWLSPNSGDVLVPLITCNVGDLCSITGFGEIPWRRERLPTPVFWSGESRGQRSLAGHSPWSCKESDTTEPLLFTFSNLQPWVRPPAFTANNPH